MADVDMKKIITDFSSYFGTEIDELNFNFDKVPIVHFGRDKVLGLRNLVSYVCRKNKGSDSKNPPTEVPNSEDLERDVVEDEWIEYALVHMGNLESSTVNKVLKDINNYIIDKVYFVGNKLGPVDVLLYYVLYNILLNLTFHEKEKYLHLSRWFNNVQQNGKARLWRSLLPFSKSRLYMKAKSSGERPEQNFVEVNFVVKRQRMFGNNRLVRMQETDMTKMFGCSGFDGSLGHANVG